MKAFSIASLALCLCARLAAEDNAVLVLSKTIPLPGIKGGFNHHAADGRRHRLFVCATTNQTVEVVDLDTGKIIKSLPGDKPAATCFAPDLDLLCVSRGKTVQFYDANSFAVLTSLAMSGSVDELHYDPAAKQIFTGCMTIPTEGIAAIDLVQRKVLGMVNLSHPQGFCLEEGGDRLFACSPQASQISIMDRKKLTAASPWKLTEVRSNYPVAYDAATHRLFVGCRKPAKLVVFNTDTGDAIATVDTGKDTDDLSFDPANKRIYVACGEGVISVVQQDDANHYRNIATVKTASGGRNGLFIPETAEFCVTVPQQGGEPATLLVFKAKSSQP